MASCAGGDEKGKGRRKIKDPSSPYYLPKADIPGVNVVLPCVDWRIEFSRMGDSTIQCFSRQRERGFLDGRIERTRKIGTRLIGFV